MATRRAITHRAKKRALANKNMAFTISYTQAGSGEQKTIQAKDYVLQENKSVCLVDELGAGHPLKDMLAISILDGAENVGPMLHQMEIQWRHALGSDVLDEQLIELKKSSKLHDALDFLVNNPPQLDGPDELMVPVVFAVNTGNRLGVGWNFRTIGQSQIGARSHFDHGAGIERNRDAVILVAPPLDYVSLQKFISVSSKQDRNFFAVVMLSHGENVGGRLQLDRDNTILVSGRRVEPDEFAGASLLPEEDALCWKPVRGAEQPRDGQVVFAWDSDVLRKRFSGPYINSGVFDASGAENKRFSGYHGPMLGGEPWSSKKTWNDVDSMAQVMMLKQCVEMTNAIKAKLSVAPRPEQAPSVHRPRR